MFYSNQKYFVVVYCLLMNFTNIYALSCPVSGSIRYIGKADNVNIRYKQHVDGAKRKADTHKKKWIRSVILKGGLPVLEIIDLVPYNEWGFWEQYYIDLYKSWGFDLVNSANGGIGGKVSLSSNQKRIESLRGQKFTDERRLKISNKAKGRIMSVETREKMSQVRKGKKPFWLKKAGSENGRAKAVVQKTLNGDFIKIWKCAIEATKSLGIRRCSICDVCKGRRSHGGGFLWEYYKEEK